jgi:hypothetical protein
VSRVLWQKKIGNYFRRPNFSARVFSARIFWPASLHVFGFYMTRLLSSRCFFFSEVFRELAQIAEHCFLIWSVCDCANESK